MLSFEDRSSFGQGLPSPQYIYANMRFKAVALEPPDFEPGSWIGAGKALIDHDSGEFLLTARPRRAEGGVRGYAANIYRSADGEAFELLTSLSKEEVIEKSGVTIASIEGTQLLRDPQSGKWYFYLSVDTTEEFVWGGIYWETLLMVADSLEGPWESAGLVIKHDQAYDACQARDGSIDIVDGQWVCLCKAVDHERHTRTQLATSADGIRWQKHGLLTVDGRAVDPFFVSGSLYPEAAGPVVLGIANTASAQPTRSEREQIFYDERRVAHGVGERHFAAYQIDFREMDLKTVFSAPWEARSEHEHLEQPLLGYSSVLRDPFKDRLLLYVEAIGPESERVGLNETVERVLVYECLL
jgi:hypothetical protein